MSKRVVVVGAGAAGLMAAGVAAEQGARVTLVEKMKLPGRKIGISGKGRCNLTNSAPLDEFISHFGHNGRFLKSAFSSFFSDELIEFFTSHGLPLKEERGGRYFPLNGRGVDVVKTLERWCLDAGVKFYKLRPVNKILLEGGELKGVQTKNGLLPADRVILATGGATYTRTGSTGDGYDFARQCGHTIIPLRPALVPLLASPALESMDGLQLRNVKVRLFIEGKKRAERFGELHFTKTGLGGPTILSLSSTVVDSLVNGKEVKVLIDLKPALSPEELDRRVQKDLANRTKEELSDMLRGLLPKQLVRLCLDQNSIEGQTRAGSFSSKDRKKVVHWLKNCTFQVTGHGAMEEAIVTAGGVKLQEINPDTMESKITKGLFIAGELLDLHADTGGYNLQAAFSTGWLAGLAAAAS